MEKLTNYPLVSIFISASLYYYTIKCSVFFKTRPRFPKPVIPFVVETSRGELYSKMVAKLERERIFPDRIDSTRRRKWVKDCLLRQIYAEPKSLKSGFTTNPKVRETAHHSSLYKGKRGILWTTFCNRYEMVMSVYAMIRQDGYRMLSRVLQRIESHAIIECACKRLLNEYPRVPIYTIHDCLVTTSEHVDLVEQIMREEITKFVGYSPTVARMSWNEHLPESMKQAV